MKIEEINKYLEKNIIPLPGYSGKEKLYRCSATLLDGIFLPCVVIQDSRYQLQLALRRFEETRMNKNLHSSMGYESIVKSFVCSGNRLNYYQIKELKPSIYAIPIERMKEMGGETSMGWTEFTAAMDDGKEFSFGTSFETMFFNMPEGYTADRIKKIVPTERANAKGASRVYREKPYFDCFMDNK